MTSKAKQDSKTAPPALDTPAAIHDPDAKAAAALVGTQTDPFLLALVICDNPRHTDAIVAYLHSTHGMMFVIEVLAQVTAQQQQFGDPSTDHGSGESSHISSGKGEAASYMKRIPDPKERLPYDKVGGWDGVQINVHLGQHDQLAGTDSDGERCTFAVALAAQIFAGPTACATWLVEYVNTHAPQAKGKATGLDAMPTRKHAAALTIASVAAAIGAGTATFGDLSWAQEALHAYLRDDDHAGGGGGEETVVPTLESYQQLNSAVETGAEVMARAAALQPGGRLILALVGVYGDDRPDYVHQMAIMNDAGTLYLYDPDNPTGTHLDIASAKSLGKYLDTTVFSSASYLIQGMAWPKATPAGK